MVNVPFTVLGGAAVAVALLIAAPVHDLTLNTPAPAPPPGAVAHHSPSLEKCPRPAVDSPATRHSSCPVLP
jgi:hypothetical protein